MAHYNLELCLFHHGEESSHRGDLRVLCAENESFSFYGVLNSTTAQFSPPFIPQQFFGMFLREDPLWYVMLCYKNHLVPTTGNVFLFYKSSNDFQGSYQGIWKSIDVARVTRLEELFQVSHDPKQCAENMKQLTRDGEFARLIVGDSSLAQ